MKFYRGGGENGWQEAHGRPVHERERGRERERERKGEDYQVRIIKLKNMDGRFFKNVMH